MALTRDQKQAQVKDLKEKLEKAESVMFAHYIGLSVSEVSDFRSRLREKEAEMKVAKKTLLKRAASEAGLEEIPDDAIEGPVSCIFSFADPMSGAQVAFKFGKDFEQVELIGGIFEGKVISKEEAIELAKMPSKEELLAKFVGMLRSPLYSFAGMCNSPLSGFARALSQIAEKGGVGDTASTEKEAEVAEEAKEAEDEPATEEAPVEENTDTAANEESSESSDSSDSPEKSESES